MSTTPTACVIGYPVAHSRSPMIHRFWLNQLGLKGDYIKVEVSPEALAAHCARVRAGEFVGGNVTIPHKSDIMSLLDNVDETARAIGAVNTIWRDGDRLLGMNTDISGFLENLDATTPGWDVNPRQAVVLGAGGGARGIVYGLRQRGFDRVLIANRSAERAEALATAMGGHAIGWQEAESALVDADVLVNTTSCGMNGKDPLDLDLSAAPASMVVADIVYIPLETALLANARRHGLRCADGLGMLLHQAVPGFERWFGVRPQVSEQLWALIVRDIEGH